MRLIDADATRKAIFALVGDEAIKQYADQIGRTRSNDHYLDALIDADDVIDDMPTIDPVRHGRWVYDGQSIEVMYKCSECGYVEFGHDHSTYCPNCGARMDGDDNA